MLIRLLSEADAQAHWALRTMSIRESAQLSCPEIVRELAIYLRIGAGVLSGHTIAGTKVWGAFDRGELVGVVALSRGLERASTDHAHMWGMYVRPEHRGGAASRALMSAALRWSRAQARVNTLTLHVHRDNAGALRWFRRFGFECAQDEELRATRLAAMQLRPGAPVPSQEAANPSLRDGRKAWGLRQDSTPRRPT